MWDTASDIGRIMQPTIIVAAKVLRKVVAFRGRICDMRVNPTNPHVTLKEQLGALEELERRKEE